MYLGCVNFRLLPSLSLPPACSAINLSCLSWLCSFPIPLLVSVCVLSFHPSFFSFFFTYEWLHRRRPRGDRARDVANALRLTLELKSKPNLRPANKTKNKNQKRYRKLEGKPETECETKNAAKWNTQKMIFNSVIPRKFQIPQLKYKKLRFHLSLILFT